MAYTTGDAHFYGLSVRDDLDMIRNILGVCLQHDVLWGDLTAKEHMELFANLKNIPKSRMQEEIRTLLEEVQLNHVSCCCIEWTIVLCDKLSYCTCTHTHTHAHTHTHTH